MNAIEWMKSKAAVEILTDGTKSYFFNGNLPRQMVSEVKATASLWRDCGSSFVYSTSGETWDWSATFGAMKSTANSVRFSFNDYTVPASDASPIVQFLRSMKWTR